MRQQKKQGRGVSPVGTADAPREKGVMKKGQGSAPRGTGAASQTQYQTDAANPMVKKAQAAENEIVRKSKLPRFPRYVR